MLELYKTPLDILYLILSIGGGILLFVLILAVIHLVGILGNIKKVTAKAKDTVDLVNHYLWQPIKIMLMVIEKSKHYAAGQAKKARSKKK